MSGMKIADIIMTGYMLFVQSRKVIFSGKFFYVFGFAVLWVSGLITINHFLADSVIPMEGNYYAMNLLPNMLVALFVSMMIVMYEKENNTIETMFSVPGSPYKVWSYKLFFQFVLLLFVILTVAIINFIFVMDFSIPMMVVSIFAPIFFIANLNFFLSVKFRNGYAAGLVSIVIIAFFFILLDPLEESVWNLYLCPFAKPNELDQMIWDERILYNKVGVMALGFLLLYLGLSKLRNREPFIE